MKRVYVILFLAVAIAAGLGLGIAKHPGYVLIDYPHVFRYESGLWSTLAALVVIVLVVFVVWVLLHLVLASAGVVNPWSGRNRERRVQIAVEQGQLDLAEGRWANAQRNLHRAAEGERQPLLYYLGAAKAANELGRHEDSDSLLERALERQPQAELAVALTHAQLQVDRGDADGARATLETMRERHPGNVQVLRQLQQLHQQRGDWPALIRLLPELRKSKAVTAAELTEMEHRAWGENLALVSTREEGEAALDALKHAWEQLSAGQRQEPALVLAYADQLRQLGAQVEAESTLRTALKRGYDSHLARLYGLVVGSDPGKQLQVAEGWLKEHADDSSLLLTLGRLSLQNSLWGKARDYLENSLRLQRNPEACAELARLLARLGETERSNQLFQEGLGLLDERLLALPLPEPARV
ncbi:heme biosynthesis HemY N-terminal domain-containing protein [Pseudomonas eucalypticola]|uniref:Heme biosynthesis protein HemY n=1 Tax=Pseudomonas eucalypticola TaxID=2599595 RepID=A0A7D5HD36_9PSED|nr:heme biosynthesis HemY N-terminal domain-containing protein [Pseudomonas eucalypticola]QKZ02506.1 heme biosynthesis protein HemY [Pseudomonas eucalypticola]